jgi:hypothetical protein
MEDKRLHKIVSNSSQNDLWLNEDVTLQNNDNVKNIIIFKFEERFWCDNKLEDRRKLRYSKKAISRRSKHFSIFTSIKNKST